MQGAAPLKQSGTHSRRERQIMDVVYAAGEASVAAVRAALPDPPSYSAVRALMRILEEKGHLRHRSDGPRYVYLPTRPRQRAGRTALRRVLHTFFENSAAKAMVAMMDVAETELTDEEIVELKSLIERSRKKGAGQ
jgi:predicted transcriptional regulator